MHDGPWSYRSDRLVDPAAAPPGQVLWDLVWSGVRRRVLGCESCDRVWPANRESVDPFDADVLSTPDLDRRPGQVSLVRPDISWRELGVQAHPVRNHMDGERGWRPLPVTRRT